MKNLYKTIPMWTYPETLENFTETNCYVTWKSDNYLWNENTFLTGEALLLWKQVVIEWWKYIIPRYIWEIYTMGLVEVAYNQYKDKFDILKINQLYRNNQKLDDIEFDESSRLNLEKCLMNQHKYYHSNETKEWWSKIREYLFIEAKKVNTYKNDVIYKQKIIHEINVYFDLKWNITDSYFPNRYFEFENGILYDTQNHTFIKDWEEIFFSSTNWETKKKFINFLLQKHPYKASSDELCKELWLKNKKLKLTKIERNKKLLDYKRSIIETEFGKYLWLTKTEISQKVLSAEKHQWYLLKWKFISDIITK